MKLQRGDIFFKVKDKSTSFLGKCINFIQRLWSSDNESDTEHTGIVTSVEGDTFESRERIGSYMLHHYAGQHIRIYRNSKMNDERFEKGWQKVRVHDGKIYPGWRLIWHLFPPLAKWFHAVDIPVCSELVAEFLNAAGLRHEHYMGTNVDTLDDEMENGKDYEKIFDGVA